MTCTFSRTSRSSRLSRERTLLTRNREVREMREMREKITHRDDSTTPHRDHAACQPQDRHHPDADHPHDTMGCEREGCER